MTGDAPLDTSERARLRELEAAERKRQRRRERRTDRECPDYADGLARQIAAHGRRVGAADYPDLGRLVDMHLDLDEAISDAVHRLREGGASWAVIGLGLRTSRQHAQKMYGRPRAAS